MKFSMSGESLGLASIVQENELLKGVEQSLIEEYRIAEKSRCNPMGKHT